MVNVTSCYLLCCQLNYKDDVYIPFKVYHSLASAKNAARSYLKKYPFHVYKVFFWEGGISDDK